MSQELQTVQSAIIPVTPSAISLGTLQAASPAALITGAGEMAKALADVIQAQNLATPINGRRYVRVEGWTTLGVMLGVVAREVSTTEQDEVYTATVELVRISDQAVISRASAECGEEKPWCSRPRYARRSMAQTRATGKACRLAFSWIMALAGYEVTPAEEIPHDEPNEQPSRKIGKQFKEHRQLEARIKELRLDRERVKSYCSRKWNVEHFPDLNESQYRQLLSKLPVFAERIAAEEAKAEREAIEAESEDSEIEEVMIEMIDPYFSDDIAEQLA